MQNLSIAVSQEANEEFHSTVENLENEIPSSINIDPLSLNKEIKRPSAEGCLFVANLPVYFSNEELSQELWKAFQKYGTIISVKASRDIKGRPFGFVQFLNSIDASKASKCEHFIGKRKIRIEKARCLRKLSISIPITKIQENDAIKLLEPWAHETDIIIVEEQKTYCSLIVKLRDDIDAENALIEIKDKFPEWTVEWLSNTTNTPTPYNMAYKETQMGSPPTYYQSNYQAPYPFWMSMALSMSNFQRPSSPTYDAITFEMDKISISPPSTPHIIPCSSPPGFEPEIFIGRINPFHANTEELQDKFLKYGEIENIQVINRPNNTIPPQDAFAFVRFTSREAAQKAIDGENGKPWMGQTLRVDWALTNAKARMQQIWSPECCFYIGEKQNYIWNHSNPLMAMMMGMVPSSNSQNNTFNNGTRMTRSSKTD